MSEEEKREMMNSFFDVLQNQTRNLARQIKIENGKKLKKSSPIKSPNKKSSPKKSPQKKENDYGSSGISYGSPQRRELNQCQLSFCSPDKEQKNRSSQKRMQMDELAKSMDGQFDKNESCSPTGEKLALPKSPVKRMRQLEEQQNK